MTTESIHAGEFLLSEGNGSISRAPVTVLSGQNLLAGAVVGRVTRAVGKADIPAVVGTGNGVMSALYAGPDVEIGAYVITCTAAVAHGGVFSVVTPSGVTLPALTLTPGAGGSTNYRSSHINFTITDGSTDFAAADVFTVTVATGAPTVVGTGNGTISAITMGAKTIPGRYRVEMTDTITNGGTGEVINPEGLSLGQGTITAGAGGTLVFVNEQLNFTLTDGSTDFVAGDFFEVFVWNVTTKKAKAWTPLAVDGSEDPAGVLWDAVDASLADTAGVIVARFAEVDGDMLTGNSAIGTARLAELGVIVR